METNNDLLKLSEKMGLRGLEDECIVSFDIQNAEGRIQCVSYRNYS